MKLLLIINHYLCISYKISIESYSGEHYVFAGTRQGIVISRAICKDISYFIFKVIDELNMRQIQKSH